MRYQEFLERTTLDLQEILALGYGRLVEDPPPGFINRTPIAPMLMFDRVTRVERSPRKGFIAAEQDVRLDAWYFHSHFVDDPVQPGCLGLDALWQLVGIYLAMSGSLGAGRALGAGEVEFSGQIRPHNRLVTYEVAVKRRLAHGESCFCVGDGRVLVDGQEIYTARDLRVGLFQGIDYADYPHRSANATGGILKRS